MSTGVMTKGGDVCCLGVQFYGYIDVTWNDRVFPRRGSGCRAKSKKEKSRETTLLLSTSMVFNLSFILCNPFRVVVHGCVS